MQPVSSHILLELDEDLGGLPWVEHCLVLHSCVESTGADEARYRSTLEGRPTALTSDDSFVRRQSCLGGMESSE